MAREELIKVTSDKISSLSRMSKGELKKMLKKALKTQDNLKIILIKRLKEEDLEKNDPILKKFFKKVKKSIKEEIKSFSGKDNEEEELLTKISKKDWKKIKDIFGENKNVENKIFYEFIKDMTFEFVEELEYALASRTYEKEVDEEVEETVNVSKTNAEKVLKK